MGILIVIGWIVAGLLGLAISSQKKAGSKQITGGDFIGAIFFGPLLLCVAVIMPDETAYDQKKSDRIIAGDADSLDADHSRVLEYLTLESSYNPETDEPIVWDKYRTKRVLSDLASLPEPLVNSQEGTYSLSEKGVELCRISAFLHHLRKDGDPSTFAKGDK